MVNLFFTARSEGGFIGGIEPHPAGGGMNHLYYGDNLMVLRDSIRDASVDLIYLDPPFNSNASYNVLFKGAGGAGQPRRSRRLTIPGTGMTAWKKRSAT